MKPSSRRRSPAAAPAPHPRTSSVARRYERFFTDSAALLAVIGFDGYFLDINPSWTAATGYVTEELKRSPWTTFVHPQDLPIALAAARRVMRGKSVIDIESRIRTKEGGYERIGWTATADPTRRCAFIVARFVNSVDAGRVDLLTEEQREEYERLELVDKQLTFLARHDALTGLPNRDLAADRLEQAMYVANRHHRHAAVIALNIDRLKVVNESLGHGVGDELLRAVGVRLEAAARNGDTVARLGADTFLVVLADVTDHNHVATTVDRLVSAANAPYTIGTIDLIVSASAGVSVYPNDGEEPDILLKNAETAMFKAKAAGGETVQYYERELQYAAVERLNLEQGLRKAVERQELVLHYQPIVAIGTGDIVAAEALVRWAHPHLGLIPPDRFIPLAEDTGLIVPLGEWVIAQACAQAHTWDSLGHGDLELSVNISARQFRDARLGAIVARLIGESGVAPNRIELELTESAIMRNPETADGSLGALKALGIRLSVDDFGTGYSSLAYLRSLPLDTIKIDRTFIRDVTQNARDEAIARTIISLAHNLGLRVVAEGVETAEQLELLRRCGCDLAQGYYFSRPVPAHDFERLLASGSPN